MNTVTDDIETMIIMALEATHGGVAAIDTKIKDKSTGSRLTLIDQGTLLSFDEMRPKSSYTFDMVDKDRLFSMSHLDLVTHPSEIFGSESEVMAMDGSKLKWFGYRRMKKAPKSVSTLGKVDMWYEAHIRMVTKDGNGDYAKRVIPISKSGKPMIGKIQGNFVCDPMIDGRSFILSASMIEDSLRSGTMLASVKDSTEIKFPVPIDDYKDVFSFRDGPMAGSRRKSIIHWVAGHLRSSNKGIEHKVKKHVRGVQEFTIDGLTILLTPNDK